MTDTTTAPQGINVTPDLLKNVYSTVAEIDERLAQASGSTAAGKRAIANQLASQYEANVNGISNQLVQHLQTLDPQTLVGVLTGVQNTLNTTFGDAVSNYLEAEVKARQGDAPVISQDELTALVEQRKQKVQEYNAIRDIIEMFNPGATEGIPVPKKMTGSRGPRGPRAMSQFQYSVNGSARLASQNSLSSIAKDTGFETTKAFKEWLKTQVVGTNEQNENVLFDTKNPPDSWSFTTPSGFVVSAERIESTDDDEDEDEAETATNGASV